MLSHLGATYFFPIRQFQKWHQFDSRNFMPRIGRYYTVCACVCVCVCMLLQPVVNVVLMEDVLCQAKDVMELTTVETIPMKLTAVCLYHVVAVRHKTAKTTAVTITKFQHSQYLPVFKVWRINDCLDYFDHILLRMSRNGRFHALT